MKNAVGDWNLMEQESAILVKTGSEIMMEKTVPIAIAGIGA